MRSLAMQRGFAMSDHHDSELAYQALAMAVAVRGGKDKVTLGPIATPAYRRAGCHEGNLRVRVRREVARPMTHLVRVIFVWPDGGL